MLIVIVIVFIISKHLSKRENLSTEVSQKVAQYLALADLSESKNITDST